MVVKAIHMHCRQAQSSGVQKIRETSLAEPAGYYHWSQIISKKDTRKKIGAFYKGITIMTSNEIDARQMDEDDLEEADRIMKLAFGAFIDCLRL
jgi:hypothetical protein